MPAQEIVSLDEYLADRGELVVLRGPSRYRRSRPVLVNPARADPRRSSFYARDADIRLPREGVALLPEVTLWAHGAILLDDGRIQAERLETARDRPPPLPSSAPERRLPKAVFVRPPAVVLGERPARARGGEPERLATRPAPPGTAGARGLTSG